ncbi:hypothetical protein C9374_009021 [Naegleria lovaniensis]|uniref:AAA+ ATPase domain-containing protein n=1 Tax=Naegleria lovaniensis TaxID=51637 RepID=A0AA88KH86_NAELO|nr:uncharacterized protein C9374_009021 [Naegleria lovaniensis]KAG2377936.1 hypothetical protein C9374_009021 [Naegleria lovaniensis]
MYTTSNARVFLFLLSCFISMRVAPILAEIQDSTKMCCSATTTTVQPFDTSNTNSSLLFGNMSIMVLVVGALGSFVLYYLKLSLETVLTRILFFQLSLSDKDEEFMWFNSWFSFHPYTLSGSSQIKPYKQSLKISGIVSFGNRSTNDRNDDSNSLQNLNETLQNFEKKVNFVPAYGFHVIYVNSQPYIIHLQMTVQNTVNEIREKEFITIWKPRYSWMNVFIRFLYPCVENVTNSHHVNDMLERAGFKKEFLTWNNLASSSQKEVPVETKALNNDNSNDHSNTFHTSTEQKKISVKTPNSNTTAFSMFTELLRDCFYVHTLLTREKTKLFTPFYQSWALASVKEKREVNTVILDEGVFEDLHSDICEFLNGRQWYKERGIPYRRGYLLYGEPGSGKTSTIMAIAACLNLDICVLNLGAKNLTDDYLVSLFTNAPANSMIVLEDIDSAFPKVEKKAKGENSDFSESSKITFSCLLNCLDGITSQESRIVFMTTNYKEKLPPSLIRNGRVDRRIYFGHATCYQCKKLARNFFPNEYTEEKGELLWTQLKDHTFCMSQLQAFFLRCRKSFSQVLEASKEFESFLENAPKPSAANSNNDSTSSTISSPRTENDDDEKDDGEREE